MKRGVYKGNRSSLWVVTYDPEDISTGEFGGDDSWFSQYCSKLGVRMGEWDGSVICRE